MTGSKVISSPLASATAPHFGLKTTAAPSLARYLTPKEFSARLREAGILICEKTVRARCRRPAGDSLRIATHPAFPGRYYIFPSEETRFLAALEVSA